MRSTKSARTVGINHPPYVQLQSCIIVYVCLRAVCNQLSVQWLDRPLSTQHVQLAMTSNASNFTCHWIRCAVVSVCGGGGGLWIPKELLKCMECGQNCCKVHYVLRLKWHLLNIPPRTTDAHVSLLNIMHTIILSVPSFWGYVGIN